MDIQQASSSSSPCPRTRKNYEVFLSFRGEDTRKNFTDHLYFALKDKGINAFRDDENLQRGKSISKELLQGIKESRISVIIFSMNYASSTWCLDELAQAHECMKDGTQIVLPVFYGVDPSEVRKQTGKYGEEIAKHEIALASWESGGKVDKWKTALTEVANQSGWDLKDRHEAEAIQEIVEDIFTKLRSSFLGASSGLVGIDSRLDELIARLCVELDDVRMVGIWGMAGIGKTTLAKAVFEKLSSLFDGSSFLYDVREADERSNLASLQRQLLNDVLGHKKREVSSVQRGTFLISQSLRCKKVLVVLDDVNKWEQLESLARSPDWFGPGSRVIITTRDERLSLMYGLENKPHRIEGLNPEESFKLFCTKAFDNEYPVGGYLDLSNEVVTYCGGLPLALQILGSFFRGRTVAQWQSALRRLKEIPDSRIMDKLQISFDGLEEKEKEIFLDIACFFKGKKKDYITAILEGCGFYPDIGLSVLKEKSLITIDPANYISMHDLLQEMGREIVRKESPQEPGNRSRLWHYKDVYHVLEKNTGTDKVEGIVLDFHQTTEELEEVQGMVLNVNSEVHRSISSKSFLKMKKLRLLRLPSLRLFQGQEHLSNELRYLRGSGYPFESLPSNFHQTTEGLEEVQGMVLNENSEEVHSSECIFMMKKPRLVGLLNLCCFQGQEYLSNELRCLRGSGYPFESLPSNFHPDKLVELHLSHSNIKQLWKRKQPLRMLKVINLSHSQNLIKTPDFNEVPNLEELILEGCTRLQEVNQSIGVLEGLVLLNLKDCKSLKELPSTICDLKSLKNLILHGCLKLKLPERLGDLTCLEVLDLGRDIANEQPRTRPWDFLLRPLQFLRWKDPSLAALTLPSLSNWCSLRYLDLSYCMLREGAIPNALGCLHLLESLDLSGNNFKSLPTSIGQLSKVRSICLYDCKRLQSLPNLPSAVQTINCRGCKSLETIPGSICGLSNLYELILSNCSSMKSLPDLPTSIMCLKMDGCASLETLPNNISVNSRSFEVELYDCKSLRTLPDLSGSLCCTISFQNCLKLTEDVFGWLKKYLHSILMNKRQGLPALRIWMSYREGGIPGSGWFNYVSEGASLKVELPPYWFNNECLGFSFGVVFGLHDYVAKRGCLVSLKAWITPENPVSVPLYTACWNFSPITCINSDVVHLIFIPREKLERADCWNSLSHFEVSITFPKVKVKVKYTGLRIVYEQDVEELSQCNWTSSNPPFHNVVSTNKRSHDDDGCSSDSQVETRPSSKRLKLEGDEL